MNKLTVARVSLVGGKDDEVSQPPAPLSQHTQDAVYREFYGAWFHDDFAEVVS